MTLIVSVVAPAFVFQVSDRRVTLLHSDGRRSSQEEPLTKSVVFCDRAVFGFTGYAQIDLMRSDLWIANQLKDVTGIQDALAKMQARLTEVFKRPQYRLGHTVTAAGFACYRDGSVHPYYAMVTNHYVDGEWLAKPLAVFRADIQLAPPNGVGVFAAPDWIAPLRLKKLQHDVALAETVELAVSYVATAIREVAAQHDEVGADLIASVLPRPSVGRSEIFLMSGGPPGDTPTFHYLPATGDPVHHGPAFVCGGNVLGNITAKFVNEVDPEQRAEESREYHRARRPQRAYLVPVRTSFHSGLGTPARAPDPGVTLEMASFIYHPTADIALVLTPTHLHGFPEVTTIEELTDLSHEWNGAFDVSYASEVTGIGWLEP